jgi:iron(III) transport system substrate-binding protein
VAIALTLSLLAAACSGGSGDSGGSGGGATAPELAGDTAWQAVVTAAKKEGHVTWYSVSPPAAREALKAAFEETYPEITVEIRALNAAEMEAALQAEHDTGAPGADVVSAVNYRWVYDRAARPDWLTEFSGPALDRPEWVDSGYLVNGKILVAPLGLVTIGWNTTLLPEGVKSYNDLLNPRLRNGAVGMIEPEQAVFADYWSFIEDHHNKGFLQAMAAQKPAFYPSAAVMNEALASGEIAVGGFTTASDLASLKDKGAPVDYVVPDPAWTAQNLFYIVKSGKNPNAAQVFVNFFASPQGQLAAAKFGATPLKEIAPQTLGGDSKTVLTNIDRMLRPGWATDYTARWRTIFGR